MADPSIQTFCCHEPGRWSSPSLSVMEEFNSTSYNMVCLTSSTLGIIGAVYQMLPRRQISLTHRSFSLTAARGRQIIIWLAFADLFASLGVFMRSILKLNSSAMMTMDDNETVIYCALFAAWIQYFYVVTWLWTVCYAVDMYLALQDRPGYLVLYHSLSWILPAILTTVGLAILYLPNGDCNNLKPGESPFVRILPNYFITYIPIATVMVLNPILYRLSSRTVNTLVACSLGQFTRKERVIVDAIRLKFGLINLVFYVCWLPNLINGIIIWSLWHRLPQTVVIALWYIMAVMNPLQALFNCLVYRRRNERIVMPCMFSSQPSSDEVTPLLPSNINGS